MQFLPNEVLLSFFERLDQPGAVSNGKYVVTLPVEQGKPFLYLIEL